MHTGSRFHGPEFSLVIVSFHLQLLLNSNFVFEFVSLDFLAFFDFFDVDGAGKVNWKGVAYYNRLIDYMIEKGMLFCDFLNEMYVDCQLISFKFIKI